MSDKSLKGVAWLAGVGLALVIVVGALIGSDSAANDLRAKAEHALVAAGLDGVTVDFEGREGELSGGSAVDLDEAESIVEGIVGVRDVEIIGDDTDDADQSHDGEQAVAPTVPAIELSRSANIVELSGVVSTADAAANIKAAIATAFGGTVKGDLRVEPAVSASSWVTELPNLFGDIVGVKDLELEIDGGTLEIDGNIESQAGADKVIQALTSSLPDLEVVNDLEIDAGTINEADAAVLNASTLYFAQGSSALTADSLLTLDAVARVLISNGNVAIEAGGHAGPKDPVRGQELSDERVAAVKAYLINRGVEADRISTKSYGSGILTTESPYAERYRRVDFIVKGI